MKLKNDFSQETRLLYLYHHECWICGQNKWDALHHILGRVSDSPLNSCPIHNFKCHLGNGKLSTDEMRGILLRQTIKFLVKNNYQFTEKDIEFYNENKKYYEK